MSYNTIKHTIRRYNTIKHTIRGYNTIEQTVYSCYAHFTFYWIILRLEMNCKLINSLEDDCHD